jgi:hypothetical protein
MSSEGERPNMARNDVLKCAELENPALCAASVSDAPPETARMAAPIRFQILKRRKGNPVHVLNKCCKRDGDRPTSAASTVRECALPGAPRIRAITCATRSSTGRAISKPNNSASFQYKSAGRMTVLGEDAYIAMRAANLREWRQGGYSMDISF